jgi:hypothetical protein
LAESLTKKQANFTKWRGMVVAWEFRAKYRSMVVWQPTEGGFFYSFQLKFQFLITMWIPAGVFEVNGYGD